MIKEAYVSYELAKLLKEKGFDTATEYVYLGDNKEKVAHSFTSHFVKKCSDILPCPTHQMAMAWLREVHKLYVDVYIVKNYNNKTVEYCITIEDLNFPSSDDGIEIGPSHKSYEEACEAAIKYCLEKLI